MMPDELALQKTLKPHLSGLLPIYWWRMPALVPLYLIMTSSTKSCSNLVSVTWNSSMSSCFQILLVPLCWSEGELEPGVSSGSFKETVFRVRFPFLLLHGSFSSGQRRTTPPTEPGFSQGFFSILSPFCLACLVGDISFPAISSTWLHRYYLN